MKLLEPLDLAGLALPNRVVMAPMSRRRAHDRGRVGALQAAYYAQRATAGLIVSEGINISAQAVGAPSTPGLYDDAQIDAWRGVTDAVHAAGGRMFAQLWHSGRVSHSSVRGGALPVAPSAIAIAGQAMTPAGPLPYEVPHALTLDEIAATIADYRRAAVNAKRAGFDGVELHGAFGYLPGQFLVDGANQRTDAYGGSIANRARFTLEVMAALVDVWGPGRAGVKLSPTVPQNDTVDSDPVALFTYLIEQLDRLPLAYLHLMQGIAPLDRFPTWPRDALATFGPCYRGVIITNGGYDRDRAEAVLTAGAAHAVSFGVPFIANPDLVRRFAAGAPLAVADRATFYGGDARGYTDYPSV